MIRKVLAFLLLVAAGLLALSLAIGGEDFAGSGPTDRVSTTKPEDQSGGIQIGATGESTSDGSQAVSVMAGGRMSIPRSRTVSVGEGTRELRVYLLQCEDSEPVSEDLLRMIGVTVDFYEVEGPPEDPVAVIAAHLKAEEAFMQLGVDENGNTSVEEDKEMRILGAVLTTSDQARVPHLTLELEEALAMVTDEGIRLYTPDEFQPFQLIAAGDQPSEITGNGLEAWLPRQGSRPGGDDVRIEVNSNPEVTQTTADGVTHLLADGPLSYVDSSGNGGAVILMEDRVRITMDDTSLGGGGGGSLRASGQRLRAHLSRSQADAGSQTGAVDAQWRRIWLEGDPASLTGRGAELRCSTLEIVPGPDGQPYLFTASGSPAVMDHTDENGLATHFRAARRIHLLRPGSHQAPLFTAFGFPRWSLGPLNRSELVIFEGDSVMERGAELNLSASEGLWLLRSLPSEDWLSGLLQSDSGVAGAPLAMHGKGVVEISQQGEGEELFLQGNMGFTLIGDGDVQNNQDIRLGPSSLHSEHRYSLRRGELELDGVGSCRILKADEQVTVELRAPGPQINASFGTAQTSLRDVVSLDASIAEGALESLVASGPVCQVQWVRGTEEVNAVAQQVRSEGPDSFRFTGTVTAPAQAHYRPNTTGDEPARIQVRDMRLSGPDIQIHRLPGDQVVIETTAPAPSTSRIQLETIAGDEGASYVDLYARRIRFMPFAVEHAALDVHAMGLPPGLRPLFALNLRSPYVIAEEQVRVTQEPELQGSETMVAQGDFLLLGVGARGGYLTGSPAHLERGGGTAQTVKGTALRINLKSTGEGEVVEMVATDGRLPELEIIDPTGSLGQTGQTDGEPSRWRIVCESDIRVLPDAVRFTGPVELRSVKADGSDDPEGPRLFADAVVMPRHPETGEVLEIQALGNVRLDWSKVTARGHSLTLDPTNTLVTVSDPDRNASVLLPNGLRHTAAKVQGNYETLQLRSWYGRVDGGSRRR